MPTVVVATFTRAPAVLRDELNAAEKAFLDNRTAANAATLTAALVAYESAGQSVVVERDATDDEAAVIAAAQAEVAEVAAARDAARASAHKKLAKLGLSVDEIAALA